MKEKTRKWLVVAGLIAVGAALTIGISMRLYKEKDVPAAAGAEESEPEVAAEPAEPEVIATPMPSPAPSAELVIAPEEKTEIEEGQQQIQPTPKKTEEEKPSGPPVLPEETDVADPNTIPEYPEEIPAVTDGGSDNQQGQSPKHGDMKDGMIYIDGFGWIPNEGGGGEGTVADDMYENGNKIGIMD